MLGPCVWSAPITAVSSARRRAFLTIRSPITPWPAPTTHMATGLPVAASSRRFAVQLPFAKVGMIGLGYIGLPTAAMLANRGVEVIGVDVNERSVQLINEGKVPIVEPDLDIAVR